MNKPIFRAVLISALTSAVTVFLILFFNPIDKTLLVPLIFAAIVIVTVSSVFSTITTKVIAERINSIDPKSPTSSETYKELSTLVTRLASRKRSIDRRLKDAARRQEEFRLITENMIDGFLTVDEVGNILTYNSAALRLLKIDYPVGGNILSFNRTREFRNVVYAALEGKRAESEMTLDSSTYNLIANPVFDDDNLIGAIIIVLDITESFKREQLRREFTSNVSHELKTPLTSISGFAEIMKSGTTDAETVTDFSSSIYDEAQRLITLVSDIIKLTELDEGSIEFDKSEVDLLELSQQIISRLSSSAEKAAITLRLLPTSDCATVFGAQKILDEMIHNLCDNAIKYNKPGGFAEISIKAEDEKIYLTVKDSGIGIPAADRARVFERFYRVDKSHSKEVGGTGLGLSIVKHGAIFHNAQIELDSTVGVGTVISVIFNK